MADEYDVIIIGSGAGGGTLAHRLGPSGKRVLILERGDWLPREIENWDATAVFVDNRYVSRTRGTTRTANRSSRRSTTSSAEPRSSTAPRCIGCARRTSASSPTTAEPRPHGRSATTSSSPTTPKPSSCTRSTAPVVKTRPIRHGAVPVSPRVTRAANPTAVRRPRPGGTAPVPRSVRDHARRGEPAFSPCIRTATCDGFACLLHAKCDAEVIAVRPSLQNENVTLVRNATVRRLETDPRTGGHVGRRTRRR